MSVVLSVEEVGPWKKKLEVEVPSPAVEAEMKRVVGAYARNVSLPGFRKGKVPASVVRKRFGEEIEREVVERLVPRYWSQARAEKQLEPLMGPTVESVELEPGQPMKFVITVEVRPEIELSENRDFELPSPETEATESEVDAVMERFRHDLADWKAVDRPAARGDRAELRIARLEEGGGSGLVDASGAELPSTTEQPTDWQEVAFEVGDERYWEELTTAVSGLASGQSGQFTRRVEHDHGHGEHGEGEPHVHEDRFRFEVVSVLEKELPEVDEAFARRLGDHESVEVLRQRIAERIGLDKRIAARRQRERAVLDQLRERNPVTLPAGAVQQEVENLLREWATDLVQQGIDLEHAQVDWQEMREKMQPDAEARLHARLLLDAVAERDDVEVTEQELVETLGRLGRAEGKSAAAVRHELEREDRLDSLRNQLRREKALRALLGEEPPSEAAPPETASTTAEEPTESTTAGAEARSEERGDE